VASRFASNPHFFDRQANAFPPSAFRRAGTGFDSSRSGSNGLNSDFRIPSTRLEQRGEKPIENRDFEAIQNFVLMARNLLKRSLEVRKESVPSA
jgi:hypothetical protein